MDIVAITVGSSWVVTGLICVGLAIPLVKGNIGRNSLYGVRVPGSLQSEDAWLAINRFGGKRLIVWSIPMIAVGIIAFFLPLRSHTGLTLLLGFAPLAFVLIPVVECLRFARRYRPRV